MSPNGIIICTRLLIGEPVVVSIWSLNVIVTATSGNVLAVAPYPAKIEPDE